MATKLNVTNPSMRAREKEPTATRGAPDDGGEVEETLSPYLAMNSR